MRETKILLVVLAAGLLAACSNPPAQPPPPIEKQAPPPPPAKKTMSMTSKSPDAVKAAEAGFDLGANVRQTEAMDQFAKAIELDPDFALAHAMLGSFTPGAAGMEHLTKAETLSTSLPEAERSYIASLVADRRGEDQKSLDLLKASAAAAPDDWHVQLALGQRLNARYELEPAATAFEKVTAIDPKNGAAYNSLGYVRLTQGKVDDAVAAFTKYAELSPTEANPQDSLGEALTAAGRFDEAEAAYQKALAIQPSFAASWGGIAQARLLRGDWKGGREALAKERETWTLPNDKADVDIALAYSHLAEGKAGEAIKVIDAEEKMSKDQSLDVMYALAPLDRARMLVASGSPAKAIALTDEAVKRAATLPGGNAAGIRREALAVRIEAEAKLGKAKDATETLARLQTEIGDSTNPRRASLLAFAKGEAAMAAKDPKAAATEFANCLPDEAHCHLEHARALKAGGDAEGAGAMAQEILSMHRRDFAYPWIEAQAKLLAPAAKPAMN